MCWIYNLNFIFENNSIEEFFLTNNICESTNRLLNMNYISVCKSLKNFEKAIKSLILIYETKNTYKEGKFSITRAIALFIRIEKISNLINSKKYKILFSKYKKYLKEHKYECDEKDNCDKILEEYYNNVENINRVMNYSSNYESSSSIASEEEIIYDYIPFENDPDNSDGSEDSRDSNRNGSVGNHKKDRKNSNNNRHNHKNKNNKKANNKNHCIYIDNLNYIKYFKEDEKEFNFCSIIKNKNAFLGNFCAYNINIINSKFGQFNNNNKNRISYNILNDRINFKLNLRKNKLNIKIRKGISKINPKENKNQ